MKKSKKTANNKLRKSRRLGVIGIILAIVVLAVGAMAAVSMRADKGQAGKADSSMTEPNDQTQLANHGSKSYVTVDAAGQTVVLDRQTGQSRSLTPEEAQRLAQGLKQLLNRSTDGLVQVRHANGFVSMDLQGRFQDVMLAKKEADGTISTACVDNVDSAAAFFDIDPALLGSKTPASQTPSSLNPVR